MRDNPAQNATTHMLAKQIRDACVNSAIIHFEDARVDGLCCEGAWEAAVEAMRQLDIEKIIRQFEDIGE